MGHEIVYCSRCQSQLRSADFEKGHAFRVGALSFCRKCAPEAAIAGADTAADPPRARPSAGDTPRPRPILKESTPKSGTRLPSAGASSTAPTSPWAIGGGVGAAVLIILIALAASTGGARPKPPPAPAPAPVAAPDPEPPPDVRPPREPVRKPRDDFRLDLARLDSEVQAARLREAFQEAASLLEAARKRYADTEGAAEVGRRLQELNAEIEGLFRAAKEEALQARRAKDEARVALIRERVARWGIAGRTGDLGAALADVPAVPAVPAVPDPPKAPEPPSASLEVDFYRRQWQAATALAAARDFAGGLKQLEQAGASLRDETLRAEHAADVAAFRAAAAVHDAWVQTLAAWPKGEKIVLNVLDSKAQPQRTEVRPEAGYPWGEVLAGSVIEALAARDPKKAALAGAGPVVFCLLDGDPEGAAKLKSSGAPLPEKYWIEARKLAEGRARPEGKEMEARAISAVAEQGFVAPAGAAEAVSQFGKLAADYADTSFVRRNREWIASRSLGAREYLFLSTDWSPSGSLRAGRQGKIDSCWIADRDDPPTKLGENFVEVAFPILPETEYKGWIFASACCAEVFAFSVHGTDFGGDAPVLAKLPPLFGLPKTHASHAGSKEPERWAWVPIPLPRYAAPGIKRVRVHTVQKGFSVAYAFVSALRSAPPRDSEVKDSDRTREAQGTDAADPSLVGLWRFNEGRGTITADSSKSRLHGVLRSGAAWGPGKSGGGLSFDGIDDSLEVQTIVYPTVVDTFTMALWARPAGTRAVTPEAVEGAPGVEKQRYVINPAHGASYAAGHAGIGLSVGTNGVSVFEHAAGHLPSLLVHDAALSEWTHVAVVFERRQPKLYLNGTLVRTGLTSTKIVHPSPASVSHTYGYYQGAVDEVRVYNRALTAAEVTGLAGLVSPAPTAAPAGTAVPSTVQAPPPPPKSPKDGLQVLYRFDEAKGTTVRDVSGVGTPLNLEIPPGEATRWIKKRGLTVYEPTILASAGPATKIIDACKASHEITIEAWVRPSTSTQTGPARIVSLSVDPNQRNFTLGQAAGTYEVRLRTTATNENGLPGVTSPGADARMTHLVYTRSAAGAAKLYLNGVEAGSAAVAGDFSSWSGAFQLALANEISMDRPWKGEFHLVAVYSRALASVEVSKKFKAGPE